MFAMEGKILRVVRVRHDIKGGVAGSGHTKIKGEVKDVEYVQSPLLSNCNIWTAFFPIPLASFISSEISLEPSGSFAYRSAVSPSLVKNSLYSMFRFSVKIKFSGYPFYSARYSLKSVRFGRLVQPNELIIGQMRISSIRQANLRSDQTVEAQWFSVG